jgi:hypothetical protein
MFPSSLCLRVKNVKLFTYYMLCQVASHRRLKFRFRHTNCDCRTMKRSLASLRPVIRPCLRTTQAAARSKFLSTWSPSIRSSIPSLRPMRFCSRGFARQVPDPDVKGISQTEYELRRTLLADSLPADSVCILIGASMKYSSDSVL